MSKANNMEKKKTKIQEYFENLPVGEVINKKGLAYLKKLGYIWDYSSFGYLESICVHTKDHDRVYLTTFDKRNAKDLEKYDGAMYEKWRQSTARTDFENSGEVYENFGGNGAFWHNGVLFRQEYFDGCFNPYLIKVGPLNDKEAVNRRMAFPGGVV